MITHYLLSYFPGLDMERRNCHGFTAMMKAAMQGRSACVRALMLTGTSHAPLALSLALYLSRPERSTYSYIPLADA